ncbi:MAG: hypothetical protein CVU95_13500 [Firmicutes bacterium HGW-Firmicutes-2]|nr:MAG: hypothetical protein CVU95_13500 [Firmicutes bacterium HGW-Firmicutes-2]
MVNLGAIYNNILIDRTKWDYYDDMLIPIADYKELLNMSDVLVENILKSGDKLNDAEGQEFDMLGYGFRLKHTISIYFLGLAIYNNVSCIKIAIDNYIHKVDVELQPYHKRILGPEFRTFDTPFSYFWFLTCFYHDYGYRFEEGNKLVGLERILLLLDGRINTNILRGRYRTLIPKAISDNLHKYFKMRYEKDQVIDHGIAAGLLFWENRMTDFQKRSKRNQNKEVFIEKDRLWSKEILYKIHLPVAWTISAHNVWFITENNERVDEYSHFGLQGLITDRPKIILNNHPLLYLLSVVDTIDPVKLLNRNAVQDFNYGDLELIEFDFNSNSIRFKIDEQLNVIDCRFKDGILSMPKWIECRAEFCESIFTLYL